MGKYQTLLSGHLSQSLITMQPVGSWILSLVSDINYFLFGTDHNRAKSNVLCHSTCASGRLQLGTQ